MMIIHVENFQSLYQYPILKIINMNKYL